MSTPNPLIPLSVETATPVTAFQAANKSQLQNQLLTAQTAGVEERTAGAADERAAAKTTREEREVLVSRFRNVAAGVKELSPLLDAAIASKDTTELLGALEARREGLLADPNVVDTQDTDQAIQMVTSGQLAGLRSQFDNVQAQEQELDRVTLGLPASPDAGLPTATRAFQDLVEAGNLTQAQIEQAARVNLGIEARASLSAAERIALDTEMSKLVAESERLKSAAKETGKLSAQLELLPEVKTAVNTAVAQATLAGDAAEENRSNQRALEIYNVAITGLTSALGDTFTGPFAGLMPAVTANQQIADGAVAAIAPVLKQLFRASGEGIFTDKDQELLLKMVPTRTDLPDSRAAKLLNIDAIVRTKLAPIGETPGAPAAAAPAAVPAAADQIPEGQTATGPNGERIVFRNGNWVPG